MAAAMWLGSSACSGVSETENGSLRIGVTYYNQNDTFLSALLDDFEKEVHEKTAHDSDVTLTIRDAKGDVRIQNDQVKEMIDSGCDVLCVNLVDRADPSEIIDLAREADVPIIFFNREPVEGDMQQWERLYYIGADAKQSGIMQGDLAADAVEAGPNLDRNHDGRLQYVILEGEAGHQDAIIRTEYSVRELEERGIALEKLSYQRANWSRAQAQNRMTQLIGEYKTGIELVLANNDDMALGAADAYRAANYSEDAMPAIFGVDGTADGIKAVLDGEISGTVYNDKEGQAEAMAELCISLTKNPEEAAEREQKTYLPYFPVTEEKARELSQ